MGSQSVTNFSATKKRQIQRGIRGYVPGVPQSASLAGAAGAAVIGSFSKSSSFTKALTSASVKVAAQKLDALAESLKGTRSPKEINRILAELAVRPDEKKPYTALAAGLRIALAAELNATQRKSEAAAAASDAISTTILDLIARKFPVWKQKASEVSREELVQAIRGTSLPIMSRVFLENVISSLLDQALDAARERTTPAKVSALKKEIHRELTPKLARDLTKVVRKGSKPPSPTELTDHVLKSRILALAQDTLETYPEVIIEPRPPSQGTDDSDQDDHKKQDKGGKGQAKRRKKR